MSAPAATESAVELITRFENTFNTYDVDALMADMTEDCVFEHIAPAEVSFGRHEGQAAVRAVWVSLAMRPLGVTNSSAKASAAFSAIPA